MGPHVTGAPRTILRLEGLAMMIASLVAFEIIGARWLLFAILVLAPDIAIVAYAAGPKVGAAAYNAVHTYVGPALLAATGYLLGLQDLWAVCLIWSAHISMDRTLGLGLKFPDSFRNTHLGGVGSTGR